MAVLFRVAAGPMIGYGHLRRAVTLARAMDVAPVVSIRGTAAARRVARQLGCVVVTSRARTAIATSRPRLVVVDDPVHAQGLTWVRSARAAGVQSAGIADAGIGCRDGDVTVDGSVAAPPGRAMLAGPRYAILDQRLPRASQQTRKRRAVVIALGGGHHAAYGRAVATALLEQNPGLDVRIAAGFATGRSFTRSLHRTTTPTHPRTLAPSHLHRSLATCAVAIVGGGVTLYEACALGTPSVAMAVVPAQRPAIAGCAARGAVLDAGPGPIAAQARRAARLANALLASPARRRRLSSAARDLVDGRGADRVARALRAA